LPLSEAITYGAQKGETMIFSIVIPVYNVEEFLDECIGSVLHQTYPNFEIILVDDGSTDSSGAICDRYASEYPARIRVFHNVNRGQMAARLYGMERACGDVCMFLDSDDCFRCDTLEKLNDIFCGTGCDMILFNASRYVDYSAPYRNFEYENGQCFEGQSKHALYTKMIISSELNSLVLKAAKRDVLAAIPDSYRNFNGHYAEDLLMSLPMITQAEKIVYMDQNFYYYRVRQGSAVNSYDPRRHISIKKVHQEMEKYIGIWGMEALRGKHYAREVRGWVTCLKQLLENWNMGAVEDPVGLLHELAEDDYFRNACDNMDGGMLTKSERLLARWLYGRRYFRIRFMGAAVRTVKNILKRKG